MSKCRRFTPNEEGLLVNCANCKLWNGTRCKDEVSLITDYEDTEEFKTYDRMMRNNKGIRWPQ
jgi:hypothetical protein